jgi:hypothetical protein
MRSAATKGATMIVYFVLGVCALIVLCAVSVIAWVLHGVLAELVG